MLRIYVINVLSRKFHKISTVSVIDGSINCDSKRSYATETYTKDKKDERNDFNTEELDQFTKEFMSRRIKMTGFQKVFLSAGSSLAAILNPARNDMISVLGETTGLSALEKQLQIMNSSEEGQLILRDKPRINTKTVDINALRKLPENTFGFTYATFLEENDVSPDNRDPVKFMDDPQLAYIMTRYRESHDLVHTVLGMSTNMLGEVAVKWIEALNTGLPMCYGAAIFGAVRLRPKHRNLYRNYYLPWAMKMAKQVKPLLPVYWEKRWDQDLSELRKELNIEELVLPKNMKAPKKMKQNSI